MKKYKVMDEKNTYIDSTVQIGENTIIYPGVSLKGNCVIGDNNIIDSYTIIEDSVIGSNNKIGPSAHIHSNSQIGSNNVIGNFVEIKSSILQDDIKVKHLSYVGDALIHSHCNIGAGVVFANYNGFGAKKEKTELFEYVFIGSNSVLVAPLKIKENSVVAASSTITEDIPPFSLAIARNRQTTKEGYLKNKKC